MTSFFMYPRTNEPSLLCTVTSGNRCNVICRDNSPNYVAANVSIQNDKSGDNWKERERKIKQFYSRQRCARCILGDNRWSIERKREIERERKRAAVA